MTLIDEPRQERDLAYHFNFVADFVGFGPEEGAVIHAAAEKLAPLVPGLVPTKLKGLITPRPEVVPE